MKYDIVIAGVDGQGTGTIAEIITTAAKHTGLHAVQSEIHRKPAREGAVATHLRIADHEITSGNIEPGQADLILAMEPLESLGALDLLSPGGTILTATDPVRNIPDYPDLDEILWPILMHPRGILVDATRLAKEAGATRASNVVLVGAASDFVPVPPEILRSVVEERFAEKGPKVASIDLAAFDAGRRSVRHDEVVDEFETFSSLSRV